MCIVEKQYLNHIKCENSVAFDRAGEQNFIYGKEVVLFY